jgi:hypothetical protein
MNNLSRVAIINRRDAKGVQVCRGSLKDGRKEEKERERGKRNERIVKIEDQHYFKNKKMIRILAIELLNTILLLVFLMIKSLLKN